jgi:hypothetical protein
MNDDDKAILNEARAAGVDSPLLFGFLPRLEHEGLRQAIASHIAARETLDAHGPAVGPEATEARKAIETHLEVALQRIQGFLGHIIGGAKVFLGGGAEATALNWPTRFRIRPTAPWCGCFRSFQKLITQTGARLSAALAQVTWARSGKWATRATSRNIPYADACSISSEPARRAKTSASIDASGRPRTGQ